MGNRIGVLFFMTGILAIQAQTRRNSFVVDLLDTEPVVSRTYHVERETGGWLFLELDAGRPRQYLHVELDGRRVLTGGGETMRRVSAGAHSICVSGPDSVRIRPARLIVRAIPEIFMYMLEYRRRPSPEGWYTHSREFLDRVLLPHCNTVVSHNQSHYAEDAAAWQSAGGEWICNQGMGALRDPDADLAGYWRGILGESMFDGVIHDEVLPQDPPHYSRWAEALPRALAGLPGKRVILWTPWGALGEPDWADFFGLVRERPGVGAVCLRCNASPDKLRTFRQVNLDLEAGKPYTLSCLMRVSGFEAKAVAGADGYDGAYSGIFLINTGWFSTCGSLIRADRATDQWQRLSRTFRPPASRDGKYHLVICPPAQGVMWIDAIRVESGDSTGAQANLVTNGGFEASFSGWNSPAQFDELRSLVQKNGCGIAIEAYMHEASDEAAARAKITQKLLGSMGAIKRGCPGFERHVTVAFSAGNAPLRYSNDRRPDICYKTHLDLQFHAAANSPAFEDVGGMGFWTLHYLDEEGVRWYGALFRHYLIEGQREPLSPWPYRLGHLANPGFEDGLSGWRISGAARVVEISSAFPDVKRSKYSPVPEGRHVLEMQSTPGKYASVSQTVRDLVPGMAYSLKAYVTDAGWTRREIPVKAALEGVEVLPALTEHRVWTVRDGKRFWNMRRVVFRARSDSATLSLGTDGVAEAGEAAAPGVFYWDFVQVEPYFMAK